MKTLTAITVFCFFCTLVGLCRSQRPVDCTDPTKNATYPEECKRAFDALNLQAIIENSTYPENLNDLLEIGCQAQCALPYLEYLVCRQLGIADLSVILPEIETVQNVSELMNRLLCGRVDDDDDFCLSVIRTSSSSAEDDDDDARPTAVSSGSGASGGVVSSGLTPPTCNISDNNCSRVCFDFVNSLINRYGCCFELIDPLVQAKAAFALEITQEPVRNLVATCELTIPASCELALDLTTSGSGVVTAAMSITALLTFVTWRIIGTL